MLEGLERRLLALVPRESPWGLTYGLARSLLATSTGLLLLINPPHYLFNLVDHRSQYASACAGSFATVLNPFCWFPSHLGLVQTVLGLILLGLASGFAPRWTCPMHAWITVSFAQAADNLNGGDQLASILCLWMLPLALSDQRRWHWQALPCGLVASAPRRIWAWGSVALIRLQVCLVYFHAAIGKFKVPEWLDGTALYYWVLDPVFGTAMPLRALVLPALQLSWVAAPLTWSVLGLELLLAAGLLAKEAYRPWLLRAGILFHLGTVLLHGIPSFALVMAAALLLYLRPYATQPQRAHAEHQGAIQAHTPARSLKASC